MLSVVRGAHGGYSMGRDPSTITVKDVFDTLEDGTLLLDCLDDGSACDQRQQCTTVDLWNALRNVINDYLCGVTVVDLVRQHREKGLEMMFYI